MSTQKSVEQMTEAEIREFLAQAEERKAKQREANKRWNATHPLTDEQKAQRKAYNKKAREKRTAFLAAVAARAKELGLA
jgi:hypothetical protein